MLQESRDLEFLLLNGGQILFMGLPVMALEFPLMALLKQQQVSLRFLSQLLLLIGPFGLRLIGHRDPRWGRGQETPGEDPMVVSTYAIEFVKGFQGGSWRGSGNFRNRFRGKRALRGDVGDDERGDRLMNSACCKHFIAYDLEKWEKFSRYSFNAVLMVCPLVHEEIFKKKLEMNGASKVKYITPDCDAVATVQEYQNYTRKAEDAVADVLKADFPNHIFYS
ncbi:hypothetical protein REPUB_Repub10bG0120600 [Reevesia pubescens]